MAGRWGQTGARAEEDHGEEGIRLISAPALHDEALVIAEFMGPLARHRGAAAFSSQEQYVSAAIRAGRAKILVRRVIFAY